MTQIRPPRRSAARRHRSRLYVLDDEDGGHLCPAGPRTRPRRGHVPASSRTVRAHPWVTHWPDSAPSTPPAAVTPHPPTPRSCVAGPAHAPAAVQLRTGRAHRCQAEGDQRGPGNEPAGGAIRVPGLRRWNGWAGRSTGLEDERLASGFVFVCGGRDESIPTSWTGRPVVRELQKGHLHRQAPSGAPRGSRSVPPPPACNRTLTGEADSATMLILD